MFSLNMSASDREPLINKNQALQAYYATLESRAGYWLVLGGTRHFGYYDADTYWPFPINRSLRAMEDKIFESLNLENGAEVLDAGCGVGHVAIHMAKRGLRVQGIDVVDNHIAQAQRNVKANGLQDVITVRKGDYHHLDAFADQSLDGVYTSETFVHATDPEAAMAEFYRVLRPGGSITLHEYDHPDMDKQPADIKESLTTINKYAAMPANDRFQTGVLEKIMEGAGFQDVKVTDMSMNIRPMIRLFFLLAYIPYLIIRFFGLQMWFVNTVAGVESYRGRNSWRYIQASARKPGIQQQTGVAEGKKIR
jgi:sterol 24-C-methyltransferase